MRFKLICQALAELRMRYATVFQQAWRERKQTDRPLRLAHETQFLPAELALQDTPVSPAPRAVMWVLIIFMLLLLTWATFGHMDVVATASGRVVPNGRIKTIQPFETATVKKIYVTDGQQVKQGDKLIELDATTAQADSDRIDSDLDMARLQMQRARSMLMALDEGKLSALSRPDGISDERFQESVRFLQGQYDEYVAKLSRSMAEIARRDAELNSSRALVRKFEQTLPLVRQKAEDFKRLAEQHFVARHGYMEQEQARIEQEASLAAQRSRVQEIAAALLEAHGQHSALSAEVRRVSLDSLNEGSQKSAALEQEMIKALSRAKLMTLTAPVDGTVQQLAVHTVGGVVTPAQPVMVIVPHDNPLEVEAFIENRDIGFVKPDQDADVKIETFLYTKYGTVPAKVVSVSHDAIHDERRGPVYSMRIKMARTTIMAEGIPVNLSPGMAVMVDVKTGKRRVVDYFLDPLFKYKNESLRER